MILRWMMTGAFLSVFLHSGTSRRQHPHETSVVQLERQVNMHLKRDETKRFTVLSERASYPLSIAITPCSGELLWSVYFHHNNTPSTDINNAELLDEFQSEGLKTFNVKSSRIGQYVVEMKSDQETYVQIFASTEPEPPHEVRMSQGLKVRIQQRHRPRRITVKWDRSPIDPHVTDYCLVVSSRRNYSSLCGASGDRYGYTSNPGIVKGNASKMGSYGNPDDPLVSCVGARTHHSVDNLEHGKMYYINLFGINKENNLTFPYGSTLMQYDKKIKHSKLKDGQIENINLKKLDGRAIFRFKAGKHTGGSMAVSVIPCGGAVDVEVLLKGSRVANRTRLYSYGQLIVPSVKQGERYLIKIISTNQEELKRTSGVEILATTKKKLILPELPNVTEVKEFHANTTCDSVTVGWFPSPDTISLRYCVITKELKRRDDDRVPNQCALETRPERRRDYSNIRCSNRKPDPKDQPMTEKITRLKPGKKYMVQVTVKKNGGRTLSYDLLTVQTTSKCQ